MSKEILYGSEARKALFRGVSKLAKKYSKPVIAFCGSATKDAVACNKHGINAFFPILRNVQSLEEAMDSVNARENMIAAVEQVFRLILKMKK